MADVPLPTPSPPTPVQQPENSANKDVKSPEQTATSEPATQEPDHSGDDDARSPDDEGGVDPLAEEDFEQKPLVAMSYGTAKRPPFKSIRVFMSELPEDLVPQISSDDDKSSKHNSPRRAKRLVIVGDVHGQKAELQSLLDKVKFQRENGDHLVLVGDMVNKGPDSAGVVELAMKLGASAVRGNNEDRVLLAHHAMNTKLVPRMDGENGPDNLGTPTKANVLDEEVDREDVLPDNVDDQDKLPDATEEDPSLSVNLPEPATDTMEQNPFSHGDQSDRETAIALNPSQLKWLSDLPVVLRVGTIRDSPFTNLVVVHAGMVPGVSLKMQDPWAVMNMRTLVYPGREARRERIKDELREAEKKLKENDDDVPEPSDEEVDLELASRRSNGKEEPDYHDDIALPIEGREGEQWSTAWVRYQHDKVEHEKDRMTVVYGHDAKRGLSVPKGNAQPGSTFGLDSGCVYGRELTALVIEASAKKVSYEIVTVECQKAAR